MLREYEFTMIISVQLSESQIEGVLQKYEEMFQKDGGVVLHRDYMGVLRLAYPISKQFKGQYVCYTLAVTVEALRAVEKVMRIDPHVLRYLSVKLADHIDAEGVQKRIEEFSRAKAQEVSDAADAESSESQSATSAVPAGTEGGNGAKSLSSSSSSSVATTLSGSEPSLAVEGGDGTSTDAVTDADAGVADAVTDKAVAESGESAYEPSVT